MGGLCLPNALKTMVSERPPPRNDVRISGPPALLSLEVLRSFSKTPSNVYADDTDDDNDHKDDSYTAAGAAPGASIISMYLYIYLWGPMGSQGPYLWVPMGSQGPGTHGPGT